MTIDAGGGGVVVASAEVEVEVEDAGAVAGGALNGGKVKDEVGLVDVVLVDVVLADVVVVREFGHRRDTSCPWNILPNRELLSAITPGQLLLTPREISCKP